MWINQKIKYNDALKIYQDKRTKLFNSTAKINIDKLINNLNNQGLTFGFYKLGRYQTLISIDLNQMNFIEDIVSYLDDYVWDLKKEEFDVYGIDEATQDDTSMLSTYEKRKIVNDYLKTLSTQQRIDFEQRRNLMNEARNKTIGNFNSAIISFQDQISTLLESLNIDELLNNKRVLIKFFIVLNNGQTIPMDSPSWLIDFILNLYKCSSDEEFAETVAHSEDVSEFYNFLKTTSNPAFQSSYLNFIKEIQLKIMIDNSNVIKGVNEQNEVILEQIEHFKNYYIYDPNTKKRCVSMCLSLYDYITNKTEELNIISHK